MLLSLSYLRDNVTFCESYQASNFIDSSFVFINCIYFFIAISHELIMAQLFNHAMIVWLSLNK